MKTKIFYFSSTGNSKIVADELAKILQDTEVINIARVFNDKVELNAERIGFVFPIYAWGVPRMVRDFLAKLNFAGKEYIFAVATYGGFIGSTLFQFRKLVKKQQGQLAAGMSVQLPGNYIVGYGARSEEVQNELFKQKDAKLQEIAAVIQKAAVGMMEKSTLPLNLLGKLAYLFGSKNFVTADKNFWVEDTCINCGLCAKLCPRDNIAVVNSKRQWKGNCEQCLACIQWCPKEAIQYKQVTKNRKRYRHPAVKAKDLTVR